MAHPAGSSAELFILYPDESLWIESDKEFCAFCYALFDLMADILVLILIFFPRSRAHYGANILFCFPAVMTLSILRD